MSIRVNNPYTVEIPMLKYLFKCCCVIVDGVVQARHVQILLVGQNIKRKFPRKSIIFFVIRMDHKEAVMNARKTLQQRTRRDLGKWST